MGWAWLEGESFDAAFVGVQEDDVEDEMERRTPQIDHVARRISDFKKEQETVHFERLSRAEEGRDDDDYAEDEAGVAAIALERTIKHAKEEAELQALEDALSRLGARMQRAYEHWNEDEKYMEWSERDR